MMLLKYCTQYASKYGKLSSGHRTGKSQFSFQSQRRAMTQNFQTTVQLCSFHMLARLYSKSFRLGFSSMWTEYFQMYKLGLEKAEEPVTNCKHLLGHRESKEIPEKHYFWFIDYSKALTVWITANYGNSERDENIRTSYLSHEKPVCRSRSNS